MAMKNTKNFASKVSRASAGVAKPTKVEGFTKIDHDNRKQVTAHRKEFLTTVFDKIHNFLEDTTEGKNKVLNFKSPEELSKLIDFDIRSDAMDDSDILKTIDNVLENSVKPYHPKFYNQLFSGCDAYSLAGDFLTTATNGSMYTYEVAPVFLLMERSFLRFMGDTVGWKDVDGIFAPGGSFANFYGVNLARHHKYPEVKTKGMGAIGPIAMLTSDESHYSLSKAAFMMGIGSDSVVKVKTDDQGRMCPEALEEKIKSLKAEGIDPFMINATVGTTVIGAIDPLDAINEVAKRYDIWVHVDANMGGPAVWSDSRRHLVEGLRDVDSIAWDFHKHLTIPLQSSAITTKHTGLLMDNNSYGAKYLFQKDKTGYDVSLDTGDMSLQCGRHIDILKTWLSFKGKGMEFIKYEIEKTFANAEYLAKCVQEHENFELLYDVQYAQTCFYYIPPSLQGKERNEGFYKQLDKVAPEIKTRMMQKGSMLIGYQTDSRHVNFFRMVNANPATTFEDMEDILTEINSLGHDL